VKHRASISSAHFSPFLRVVVHRTGQRWNPKREFRVAEVKFSAFLDTITVAESLGAKKPFSRDPR